MDGGGHKTPEHGQKRAKVNGEVVRTNATDGDKHEVKEETDSAVDAAASELEEWFAAARFGDLPMLSKMARSDIINTQDSDGSTALFKATSRNRLEACTVLLASGADPSIKTNSGETPLHMAARWGYSELARLLLDAGASAYDSSSTGETPFGLAKLNRKRKVLAIIQGTADLAPKRLSTQGSSVAAAVAPKAALSAESVDLEPSTTSSPWGYCSIQ
mmetsp:Transcript_43907/g.91606  ORF Transcript_43907/g.91606 Transcript_43907/m.91606 type:complete len:217 (+) Transcript_43907:261-911(+)